MYCLDSHSRISTLDCGPTVAGCELRLRAVILITVTARGGAAQPVRTHRHSHPEMLRRVFGNVSSVAGPFRYSAGQNRTRRNLGSRTSAFPQHRIPPCSDLCSGWRARFVRNDMSDQVCLWRRSQAGVGVALEWNLRYHEDAALSEDAMMTASFVRFDTLTTQLPLAGRGRCCVGW